ncbi:MAG: CGNR zinc finger domain-containing protein [Acidimicrobiia bacterium]
MGENIEPGGRDPAPSPLQVVQKFVNTYNHELGHERDRLGNPAAAGRWLIENSLLGARQRLSLADTRRLHQLREVIRALAARSSNEEPAATRIDDLGFDVCLRVRIGGDGRVQLEPTGAGVERVIGALLAIVHDAMIDGSWPRMKVCRQCAWLFFDHSRNRSGGWCSMAVCGNRSKNRSYRRRSGQY